ncbi:hypothetical protein BOSP111201_03200 [Bordetella sputigena]
MPLAGGSCTFGLSLLLLLLSSTVYGCVTVLKYRPSTYSSTVNARAPSSSTITWQRHVPFADTVTGPLVHSAASFTSAAGGSVGDDPLSLIFSVAPGWPVPVATNKPFSSVAPLCGVVTSANAAILNSRVSD